MPTVGRSASPALGIFGFNNQPPASNAEYRRYIAGVALGLVAEFGRDEVARWRWGVFTEYVTTLPFFYFDSVSSGFPFLS